MGEHYWQIVSVDGSRIPAMGTCPYHSRKEAWEMGNHALRSMKMSNSLPDGNYIIKVIDA